MFPHVHENLNYNYAVDLLQSDIDIAKKIAKEFKVKW